MITEKDMEQYLGKPVRVKLTNGKTFDGVYRYWQLGASLDVPDAMDFTPLDGTDLQGGMVEIEADRIAAVKPLAA